MARGAIPIGDATRNVAANVHRLRKARGLTVYSLSVALREAGRPIAPEAVCKIENGARADKQARRVDVDDLAALSAVLNVTPGQLLADPATLRISVEVHDA